MKSNQFLKYILFSLILFIVFSIGRLNAQDTINHDLLEEQAKHFSPKEKVGLYLRYFSKLIDSDIQTAADFNKKAFTISIDNKFISEQASCYYNFGLIDRAQSKNSKGIKNFKLSLDIYKQLNEKEGQSQCYNNLGILHKNKEELKISMQYYLKALKTAEDVDYNDGVVDAISNIAVIYLQQEEYEQAIKYLKKSFALQKDDYDQYIILNNLGIANEKLKKYTEALNYYKKSLDICIKKSEYKCQAKPLSNMGGIYLLQGNHENALNCFFKAQEIEESYNLQKDLIASYTNIALVYRMQKKYEAALTYFNKAETIAKQTSENSTLLKIYLGIALTNEEYEKYVNALDYLYNYIALNKSLYNLDKTKQIQELLAQFEAENKEKEILLLKKDNDLREVELKSKQDDLEKQKLFRELETKKSESSILLLKKQNEIQSLSLEKKEIETEKKKKEIIFLTKEAELQDVKFEKKQAELKQKNTLKNIAIIASIFIIISAVILIFLYQQKLRTVELLNLKTEEINKQKIYELLQDQELISFKSNLDGQDKERKRIAQDLHDGIGGNLASIKLNLANIIRNTKNEKLLKVMRNIDDTYNEVRTISHNLVPSKIMNEAFIKLIRSFIDEISVRKLFLVKFTAFPEIELNGLPNEIKIEIYRITQELMNNIIKYSKSKNVDIQLILRDGQVNLMVEDDGVGFDTNSYTHGIGLRNIRSRVRLLEGDISIDSSKGQWTLVNIEIPINNEQT